MYFPRCIAIFIASPHPFALFPPSHSSAMIVHMFYIYRIYMGGSESIHYLRIILSHVEAYYSQWKRPFMPCFQVNISNRSEAHTYLE